MVRKPGHNITSMMLSKIVLGVMGHRIKEELSKKGYRVSRPIVARIMRANNLFAGRKRRFKITTDSEHNYPVARNILNQNFTVFRKNQA